MIHKRSRSFSGAGKAMLALISTFVLSLLLVTGAHAKIGGYNVILIHGLDVQAFINKPTTDYQLSQNGYKYWSNYWAPRAEERIDWNANERVQGGIAQRAFNRLKQFSQAGLCTSGCVVVTHSTGDLVARHLLENQAHWLQAVGLQPLRIIAVVDIAGAGGGTELADHAMAAAYNNAWYMWPVREALDLVFGFSFTPAGMGVINDLQPTVARNTSAGAGPVPRLRFVGTGNEFLGIPKPFIKGSSDSVVPLHSACGASTNGSFESCSRTVGMDGARRSRTGPSSFMHNHYPIIMSENGGHNQLITTSSTGDSWGMTYMYNGYNFNGLITSFPTKVETRWYWIYDYQYVTNTENRSMSTVIYNRLNATN